jgi:hypothetical protein
MRNMTSVGFTLPWRGRVGVRSTPGWGDYLSKKHFFKAVTPIRPPPAVDLPPLGGGEEKRAAWISHP